MKRHDGPRIFISHSHHDKPFVRRLVSDLVAAGYAPWLDERELAVGDSIVAAVSTALGAADYVLLALSRHSANSRWVQAEWSAALAEELARGGTTVLPLRLDDAPVPPLLVDRLCADFRVDHVTGLAALLSVLSQEKTTVAEALVGAAAHGGQSGHVDLQTLGPALSPQARCIGVVSAMRLADLRRLILARMSRSEVATLWFDTFEDRMDDEVGNRFLAECVVELLVRSRKRGALDLVIESLCHDHAGMALASE